MSAGRNKLVLHMEQKKAFMLISLFSVLIMALGVIILVVINQSTNHISTLMGSSYEYSVISAKPVEQDEYFRYAAGISFSLQPEIESAVKGEILMQSDVAAYTDQLSWNANALSSTEIAVSTGLAKENGIAVGTKLYSKHVISGEIVEYTVKQILPEISSTRFTDNKFTSGVVIMGYDSIYADNLSHEYVIYTQLPIEDLTVMTDGTLKNIVYRDDEIRNLIFNIAPYVLVLAGISSILLAILDSLIVKEIRCNLKRMIALGFEKKRLDKVYRKTVYRCICLPIVPNCISMGAVMMFTGVSKCKFSILCMTSFLNIIILVITTEMQRKRLWRG